MATCCGTTTVIVEPNYRGWVWGKTLKGNDAQFFVTGVIINAWGITCYLINDSITTSDACKYIVLASDN